MLQRGAVRLRCEEARRCCLQPGEERWRQRVLVECGKLGRQPSGLPAARVILEQRGRVAGRGRERDEQLQRK